MSGNSGPYHPGTGGSTTQKDAAEEEKRKKKKDESSEDVDDNFGIADVVGDVADVISGIGSLFDD